MPSDTKPVQIPNMPVDLWHHVRIAASLLDEGISEFVIKAISERVKEVELQRYRGYEVLDITGANK